MKLRLAGEEGWHDVLEEIHGHKIIRAVKSFAEECGWKDGDIVEVKDSKTRYRIITEMEYYAEKIEEEE